MGFIGGLLVGLAASTAILKLARPSVAEAPGGNEASRWQSAPAPLRETLEHVKQRASEAIDAAQEAAQQTEEQLRREYGRAADHKDP